MKDPKKMYDKKAVKQSLKKYIILMVCFLPILILLNFTLFAQMSSVLMIFLDVVLCLGFVFVAGSIWNTISAKQQEKREELRKQRELERRAQNTNVSNNHQANTSKKMGKRRNRSKNKNNIVNNKEISIDNQNSANENMEVAQSSNMQEVKMQSEQNLDNFSPSNMDDANPKTDVLDMDKNDVANPQTDKKDGKNDKNE